MPVSTNPVAKGLMFAIGLYGCGATMGQLYRNYQFVDDVWVIDQRYPELLGSRGWEISVTVVFDGPICMGPLIAVSNTTRGGLDGFQLAPNNVQFDFTEPESVDQFLDWLHGDRRVLTDRQYECLKNRMSACQTNTIN